jgi:predicted ATPase
MRLGIHTAWAVVSGSHAGGQRQQVTMDMAPNLPIRLGGIAHPNTVIICTTTYQQVQGWFDCEPLSTRLLTGLRTAAAVYRVVREKPAANALAAHGTLGLTPLVGRQEEVRLLSERWQRAQNGHGQVVLLRGEPGIGKSRLIHVLKEQAAAAAHTILECRCSPFHRHSALYPVIDLCQRVLGVQSGRRPEDNLQILEVALSRYGLTLEASVPLLATLLSLPLPAGRYAPRSLSPQGHKQLTLALLLRLISEMTRTQPVCLVVEDVHWVDPSTLELLTMLAERAATMRLFLLVTCRPAFQVPWETGPAIIARTLSRLAPQDVARMLTLLTGGKALPSAISEQLLAKTDGIPLFIEELTKMVLESGLLHEHDDGYELAAPLPPLAIPATLHDSLMARLDRLPTGKSIAQLGATVGRAFSYTLLRAVANVDETTLRQALEHLVNAGLLYVTGTAPECTYIFKHTLIQETAYQTLLKGTRQQYHQRIAEVLVEQFPDLAQQQPEVVAYHYTTAELAAQAIPYWQQAGVRAAARSACAEAIAHLKQGLALVQSLAATPEHLQQELDLQTVLGPTLMAVQSPVAPEVEQTYARARVLCQRVGITPKLVWALEGLWAYYLVRGKFDTAGELGEQLLDLAQHLHSPVAFAVAHQALGLTRFYLGELLQAATHLEAGVAYYALQPRRSQAVRGIHDPGVMCHAFAGLAAGLLGYPDQALLRIETTLQLAQELAHPYSLAFAHCAAAVVHQYRREARETAAQAEAAIAVAREQGFPLWAAMGTVLRGWALTFQGQIDAGIADMRQGIAIWGATGAANVVPYYHALLAEAYGEAGEVKEALQVLEEACVLMQSTGERWWEAEILRLQGVFLLQQPRHDVKAVDACFRQAMQTARHQGAQLWQLRTALSWSALCARHATSTEVYRSLRDAYAWFTEGHDLMDLQQAREQLGTADGIHLTTEEALSDA